MDFVPGALVAGRYRLRRMVGSGGMGEVWSGEDVRSGTRIAVKHLLPAAAKHHEVVARFKREAFLLGRVESEYVARVVEFLDDESYGLVLVMEYIEGPSLAHILEQRVLNVEEAIDLAADLLRALNDLHTAKIVHRDLKPGNIIMRPTAAGGRHRATVVDFGISRLLPSKGENEVTGITRANIALGTVEYMAPEQILNSRDVTPVTDLYAVGIILFRSLKGHHAFGDRRGEELARAKLIEDAPALETGRNDDVARGITSVVARALKKKPSQRYPSAAVMLEEVLVLQRLCQEALDLDDSTTDSGETAVKRSPLAPEDDEDRAGRLARLSMSDEMLAAHPPGPVPMSTAGPKVEIRRPGGQAPPHAPSSGRAGVPPSGPGSDNRPPSSGVVPVGSDRAAMRSNPEIVVPPAPRSSGADWSVADANRLAARASIPSISDGVGARGSMPSIPDSAPRGSMPSMPDSAPRADGAPMARASLPSIPDYGQVVSPPPKNELTTEGRSPVTKGTIALAILTSFAVGAAVGLIVAPTSAPAGKAAEGCPPCASAAAAATATAAAAAEPVTAAPIDLDDVPTSASGSGAVSSSAKPVLTGKLLGTSTAAKPPTSKPTSDGLGEDDHPPKPPPTGTTQPPPPPQGGPPGAPREL